MRLIYNNIVLNMVSLSVLLSTFRFFWLLSLVYLCVYKISKPTKSHVRNSNSRRIEPKVAVKSDHEIAPPRVLDFWFHFYLITITAVAAVAHRSRRSFYRRAVVVVRWLGEPRFKISAQPTCLYSAAVIEESGWSPPRPATLKSCWLIVIRREPHRRS